MRERYPDGRVNIIMAAKFVVSSRYRDRRQTNEKKRRKKTEIAPGEFQSECMLSGGRMMDREREREREEESLNAYTYHHLACLPINF